MSVVIVSYNTRALLEAALSSLLASERVRLEVFVVDNASRDGSPEMVERTFPAVRLIRNPENRGFAAANNLAFPLARGRFVLLLNPDTIVQPSTVARLAAYLDSHPEVGITGPRVLNADGSLQSCGYWYPSLLREIRLSKKVNRALRVVLGDEPPDPDPWMSMDVDWVDGCCLMVRRAVIDRIGLLDEQFFLYAEELDWCRSARNAGWRIATCPAAEMTHLQGKSSEQVKASALSLLVETRLRYYRKQDGLPTALLVSAVYALGFAKQWRAEPEKNRAKMTGVRRWWAQAFKTPRNAAPAESNAAATSPPRVA